MLNYSILNHFYRDGKNFLSKNHFLIIVKMSGQSSKKFINLKNLRNYRILKSIIYIYNILHLRV